MFNGRTAVRYSCRRYVQLPVKTNKSGMEWKTNCKGHYRALTWGDDQGAEGWQEFAGMGVQVTVEVSFIAILAWHPCWSCVELNSGGLGEQVIHL